MSARPVDQDVTQQLSSALQSWLRLERHQLHRPDIFFDTARDPCFDARYLPQNSRPFSLPCYRVPRRDLFVVTRGDSDEQFSLGVAASNRDEILFPIHPTALDRYRGFLSDVGARDASLEARLWAVPTSSIRTLLVWPDGQADRARFVKTSLLARIVGERPVSRMRVARAIGFARIIEAASDTLPGNLHFIAETGGFSPRQGLDAGAIVRPVPQEILSGEARVAPLFSLIGGDEEHVPLLLRMLQKTTKQPLQFVDDILCASFASLWVEMALRHGVILEAHAQDLLLGLSADGMPSGHWYYRDFEGLQVDWRLRRACGHPPPDDLPHAWAWRETYDTLGHRYCDFVWYKWRTSLQHYLHHVLNEIEISLRRWHQRGLIGGPDIQAGELTLRFSRHLFDGVGGHFNGEAGPRYNIYGALNRFLASLSVLRKTWLRLRSG